MHFEAFAPQKVDTHPENMTNVPDKLRAKLASFIQQLDRASAPAGFHRRTHEYHRSRKIIKDELSRDPNHVIPEALEISIPPRIRRALPSVDATIHLHNQPDRRSGEVRDVPAAEHDLPTKRDTEAAPAELPPEQDLRLRSEDPHIPSARSEELLASGRD